MYNLRSLKFSTIAARLLMIGYFFPIASSASSRVGLIFEWLDRDVISFQSATEPAKFQTQGTQTLNAEWDQVLPYWALSGAMSRSTPDYSDYRVIREDNRTFKLSNLQTLGPEWSGALGATYQRERHQVRVGWEGSVTQSPFAFQALNLGYQLSLFDRTTILGSQVIQMLQWQPWSYFTNRQFRKARRPELIHAHEVELNWEQVLGERWKARAELATFQQMEERPRGYRLGVSAAHALSSRWTAQLKSEFNWEDEPTAAEPLKNERGYYDWKWAEASLHFEPIYDWWITASYALGLEREFQPDEEGWKQLATEQVGLGVTGSFGSWELQAQAKLMVTNTETSGYSMAGGLAWKW